MNLEELFAALGLDKVEIVVNVINPVRKDDWAKTGRITGFKTGLYGGGHYNYQGGRPRRYSSVRVHWIKKPKIHVTYNAFEYGGKEYSDWIEIDNCSFEIKPIVAETKTLPGNSF